MSKGRLRVAIGAVSLVVLLAGSGFTARESAAPIPGRLVAYDVRTGTVRFDVPTASASASIHTVGAGVIAVVGAASCRRLQARRPLLSAYSSSTGARLWHTSVSVVTACEALPVAAATRGVIVLGAVRGLEGVAASDGAIRWRRAGAGSSLTTSNGVVAASAAASAVEFIDGSTGRLDRSVTVRSSPAPWFLAPRTAIVWATRGTVAPRSRLVAIDRASGRHLWQRTLPRSLGWPSGSGDVVVASWQTVPGYVADPSQLATATGKDTATTAAFDVRTGRRLWGRVTPLGRAFSLRLFSVGAGLALYVHDGMLEALDLHTGVSRWRATLATGKADGPGSIVAGAGSVAVVDPTNITVFDARNGARRWSKSILRAGVAANGAAVISAGRLLVPENSTSFIPYNG